MGLVVYKEQRQSLSEISFLKDVTNQVKIKDIPKEIYKHELIKSMILINNLSGIKEPMSDVVKTDIKEMILMRFKTLSFDQIYYAFKLERFGGLGNRIEHYQLFDAKYVSEVLDKFLLWKKTMRVQYNINLQKQQENETSKDEQEFIMIEAVDRIEKEFKHNKKITGTFVHVYDYLFAKGVLPQHTNKFKSRILEKSKEIAKFNAENKAGSDYGLHKQLKSTLENIENNNHDAIKTISKRLVLEEYFKNK